MFFSIFEKQCKKDMGLSFLNRIHHIRVQFEKFSIHREKYRVEWKICNKVLC